ncbi:ABC transporter permease [Mariniluteicoccus endophyticus]
MKRASLWIGAVLVAGVVLTALLAVVWTPFDPEHVVPDQRMLGPGLPHLLGTDNFGIDIFSRLMAGARVCLMVGVIAVGIAALVGVPLGMLAGMARGWLGELVMRGADILYAFPALLLAILLAAAFGGSTWTAMTAIGIATVPAFIRVARAATMSVMSADYVVAARSSGTSHLGTAVRHVLPNIAPVVGVQASVSFGIAILAEAALSYLGLGTPPPQPTWGRMLREAQTFLFTDPLQALWPGLAIALAVLGFNLLGDGLRDLLDPRLKEAD